MPSLRLVAGILLAGAMAMAIGASASLAGASGRSVEIDIRYSLFAPTEVRVPVGVPVRFVIVNHDPIDHEWIVGDQAVHTAHRTGTEPVHGARSTEQTIDAGQRVETVITFDSPGRLTFVCHLPGHESYGMTGALVVSG